jgi:hypothetical protein
MAAAASVFRKCRAIDEECNAADINVFRGIVHGKTIELERESGLPDGRQVTVILQAEVPKRLPPGEGIRRSAGAWAEDGEDLDRFLEWSRQQRSIDRPELES